MMDVVRGASLLAREKLLTARQWLGVLWMVPSLVLGRLEYMTGVSGVAWRNAVASVLVGIVASILTAVVLRR